MDTRNIVKQYFDNVNAGEWDKWLNLFDENIVMDEQLSGHIEGINDLAKSIEGLRSSPKFQNHLLEFVVEGNRAMANWHLQTTRPDGKNIEVKGVNYYKIKNGKIIYFANFHDTLPFR